MRWLSGYKDLPVFQNRHAQYPAPVLGGAQLPVTPAPLDLDLAPSSDLHQHCIHICKVTYRHTQIYNEK